MATNKDSLESLPNIGTTLARRLRNVGIFSKQDLRRVGPPLAYQLVKQSNPDVSLPLCYYLYSLEGALRGIHWDRLSNREKARLKSAALGSRL